MEWRDEMSKTMTVMIGKYRGIIVSIVLATVVLTLYWPVTGYKFIALDDNLYIVENHHVQRGITAESLAWAMTTFDAANWHPLTWLSLMADYNMFGLNAGGYHMNSLLLHLLNSLLLFFILRRMTGKPLKCAFVAALFAVHPLNIESVVWVAERKNLLSTVFWLLTILTYIRYVEKQGWGWYMMSVVCFVLGLMAKPMLVTLPFILLLLDYWPLQRLHLRSPRMNDEIPEFSAKRMIIIHPLIEKIPFFILSILSVFITFHAAQSGGAVKSVSAFPLTGRIANAFISYVMYLVKMVWPSELAIFYPYSQNRPAWQVTAAVILVVLASGIVFLRRRGSRYLTVGWLWYLVTLLPVIGLIQVGFQSMANRYAYISLIGIFIIIAWSIPDLLKRVADRRYLLVLAVLLILALAFSTREQLPHWQSGEAAFLQALKVTENNHIAQMGMGNVWLARGDLQMARQHYEEALRIKPDYAEAHNNFAMVLMQVGRMDEAVAHYRDALKDSPNFAQAYNNLGVVLAGQRKFHEAEVCFKRALELKPEYVDARHNLTMLFTEKERLPKQ